MPPLPILDIIISNFFKLCNLFRYSELTMRPLADNPIKCSICKEVFTDPVCIPCGDSYCRMCITLYWKDPTQKGVYDCPQCSQTYSTRPELYVNGVVVQIIKRAKLSSARLGDLTCDFCTGQKLRAVKFCLTCSVAYCEVHIKQHYTVLYCRSTDLRRPQVELERYEN